MQEVILLGILHGVSKTSNKPYYVINLGVPITDANRGTGYAVQTHYVDENLFKEASKIGILSKCQADIRFSRGVNFLVSISK